MTGLHYTLLAYAVSIALLVGYAGYLAHKLRSLKRAQGRRATAPPPAVGK